MKRFIPILITIIAFCIPLSNSYSQTSIGGIINQYAAVDSIYPTKDTLGVASTTGLFAGDTVMVIQMKGAIAKESPTDDVYFWGQLDQPRQSGFYEIIIIEKIEGSNIIFRVALENDYNQDGNLQVVRIPTYKEAVINSTITCPSWDGTKGGVVAILVHDTLDFQADINVDSKGFRGADAVLGIGQCAREDSALYRKYVFPNSFMGAGLKGEGIAAEDLDHNKGVSRWTIGGGGGNARWSGGGGGGNANAGGNGGNEDTTTCEVVPYIVDEGGVIIDPHLGGRGGVNLAPDVQVNRKKLYMGGGGGSGTYTTIASNGANGGGIVFILSNYIKGNDNAISARGDNVSIVTEEGAGGGGAGGSILFDVDKVESTININFSGGNGGWTKGDQVTGPGGGGGGGFFFNPRTQIPANIAVDPAGGEPGDIEDRPTLATHGAGAGGPGSTIKEFTVPLTGFLFNSIVNDQLVCLNEPPDILSGSTPRGGDGIFTITWEVSSDKAIWNAAPGINNQKDYAPDPITDTIYYRRKVVSHLPVSGKEITDISNTVKLTMQPRIQNNSINGVDLEICYDDEADSILGTTVKVGGSGLGTYSYFWQVSNDLSSWNVTDKINDTLCMPGNLTDTSYFRRLVISGGCIDTSNIEVIDVLPLITNNNLNIVQDTICNGQIPNLVVGSTPQNGNKSVYNYTWEKSSNETTWNIISDSTRIHYQPGSLAQDIYYRRTIRSGDCVDISDTLRIEVLDKISNNNLTNNVQLYTCYNIPPEELIGATPGGGDNLYRYSWEESLNGNIWNTITDSTRSNFQPDSLTVQTYYRRIIKSGENDCCADISDSVIVDIHSLPIVSLENLDTTICSEMHVPLNFSLASGQIPYSITYGYRDNEVYTANDINSANTTINHSPAISEDKISEVIYLEVKQVSDINGCLATEISGVDTITLHAWPNADAGIDIENCDTAALLEATPSIGTGKWSMISGNAPVIFKDDVSSNDSVFATDAGKYQLQWKETNWQCANTDTVQFWVYQAPQNVNAGKDTIIFFIDEFKLSGKYLLPDEEVPVFTYWEVIEGYASITNPDAMESNFTGLDDSFNDEVKVLWTVSKGVCEDITDTVNLDVKDVTSPTGFSPNDDGVNDRLVIRGLENSPENEVIIFNRWGVEVYREKNYSNDNGWDGRDGNGNEMPEETYYYVLSAKDVKNRTHTYKGYIVLKRQ